MSIEYTDSDLLMVKEGKRQQLKKEVSDALIITGWAAVITVLSLVGIHYSELIQQQLNLGVEPENVRSAFIALRNAGTVSVGALALDTMRHAGNYITERIRD